MASEITLLVASASCWHLIFSAVAFSNADVRLLRLALSSWEEEQEGRSSPGRERPSAGVWAWPGPRVQPRALPHHPHSRRSCS